MGKLWWPGLDTWQTLGCFFPVLDPNPTSNSLDQLPGLLWWYRAGLLLQL